MKKKIRKAINILKENGLYNGSKLVYHKIKKNNTHATNDLESFYQFINFPQCDAKIKKSKHKKIKILWFIPDFGIGSGGHLNIFRMISNLHKLDIDSDIAICGGTQWNNSTDAKKVIDKFFFKLDGTIEIIQNEHDITKLKEYDIAMATSWQSAYYVRTFANCIKKTYFIQDYEPYFFAHGSNYFFAKNTYEFNFLGVSAGDWIAKKVKKKFGMQCESFSFSYDKTLYSKHPKEHSDSIKRVFFYARPPTERRGFELGLMALEKLYSLNKNVEVIFAGWDVSGYKIRVPHLNAGVVSIDKLSHLYAQCDVALVLSYTNLSLLPLELLASGCPVVVNKGLNNSWIDPEHKLFVYAENTLEDTTKKLNDVLHNKISFDHKYIEKFLEDSSWENEAFKVKNILVNYLEDH